MKTTLRYVCLLLVVLASLPALAQAQSKKSDKPLGTLATYSPQAKYNPQAKFSPQISPFPGMAGDVFFSNGTTEVVDHPNFFWDGVNHRLGIGTATPAWPIDMVTDGSGGYFQTTSYRESVNGGGLLIQHARGTLSSPVVLNSGDHIGSIFFNPYNQDGTFNNTAVEIQGALNSQSSGVAYGKLRLVVQSSFTPAMTVIGGMSTGVYITDVVSIGDDAPPTSFKFQVVDNQLRSTSGRAGFFKENASYDTTGSALKAYGGYFESIGSRNSGINPLTNIGLYATAASGQKNYAAIFDQGNVGIGTITPKAVLEVASTTSGFLPPRMSQSQRDAIASPAEGLVIYNLTTHKLNVFTGSVWETIMSN